MSTTGRRLALFSLVVLLGSAGGGAVLTHVLGGNGNLSKPLDTRVPVDTRVPLDTYPGLVALGEGALWVLTCDRCSDRNVTGATARGRLLEIDPRSGQVLRAVSVSNPGMLAAGEGGVWITNFAANTVTRIDPGMLAVTDVISLRLPFAVAPGDRQFLPLGVTVGEGAVWVGTGRGVVARIDPKTDAVTHMTRLPSGLGGDITTGGGAVWVADGLAGIHRIDPSSGRIVGTTRITRGHLRLTVGLPLVAGGALWAVGNWSRPDLSTGEPDYVFTNRWGLARMDPATGSVTNVVPVRPFSTTAQGPGGVWIIQPGTSLQHVRSTGAGIQIRTFSVDLGRFLAFDGRGLLVVRDDGTIRRLAFRSLFESPTSVRPRPRCNVTSPALATESDSLSRSSGSPGQEVAISGPTLRTEDWRYAPASFVEVVWNTKVAVSDDGHTTPPPLTPGPVRILAKEPILGQCRFHVTFRVPQAPPGRYRITVLIWDDPPSEGYGVAGVEHFRVKGG